MNIALIILTLTASLSLLLTLTFLWQLKEWRLDRLIEHLRSEGWFAQLFGIVRPIIIAIGLGFVLIDIPLDLAQDIRQISVLGLLTFFNGMQALLRRQPYPVWTKKAIILVNTSILLNLGFLLLVPLPPYGTLFIPLLQSVPLLISWFAWKPIDLSLKKEIFEKARREREKYPNLTVIGITGSVGKTTTKELISHILKDSNPLTTTSRVNTDMGVANWLLKELKNLPKDSTRILIVEMGAYRKGEIALLSRIAQPNIGIITYIGTQHLALFGSHEKIARAKGELFEALPQDGKAFINKESPFVSTIKERTKASVSVIDPQASGMRETPHGLECTLSNTQFRIPVHGLHNTPNILLAIACAQNFGMNGSEIAEKLSTFSMPERTFSVRKESGITILDDSHNASPESFDAAIEWTKKQPHAYKILLTPGIIELGSIEDVIHEDLGQKAQGVFDRIIFTHKTCKKAFEKGCKEVVEIFSKKSKKAPKTALVVCIGRTPPSVMTHLLPKNI
jgi:UDP-N-acetylmuramoyl-tripeptide--D-alanyl-D-alanine ligase